MLEFRSRHQLPQAFQLIAEEYYLPLARKLPELRPETGPLFLGINGAQGTGKSTLADFLRLVGISMFDWNVAVLSLDDFDYTKEERTALANDVHPLLMTRGVPGTHDTVMLAQCLSELRRVRRHEEVSLPRFDKAIDDRDCDSRWPVVSGPIDLIVLEGWCVGSQSQTEADVREPINALERGEDIVGTWRRYANDQLRVHYAPIFDQLDMLVFLKAPSFDAILRWRIQQELKLAETSHARLGEADPELLA
jgi:D-glycerate 3-kinase